MRHFSKMCFISVSNSFPSSPQHWAWDSICVWTRAHAGLPANGQSIWRHIKTNAMFLNYFLTFSQPTGLCIFIFSSFARQSILQCCARWEFSQERGDWDKLTKIVNFFPHFIWMQILQSHKLLKIMHIYEKDYAVWLIWTWVSTIGIIIILNCCYT